GPVVQVPVEHPGAIEGGMLAKRWQRDVRQVRWDDPHRQQAVISGGEEALVLQVGCDGHLPVTVARLVLHLLDEAAYGRAVRDQLETARVMDMRQWITAAWRGSRLPRGRAHRLTQYAGWTVQGVPDAGSSDQQDDDGDHKLHPGKP